MIKIITGTLAIFTTLLSIHVSAETEFSTETQTETGTELSSVSLMASPGSLFMRTRVGFSDYGSSRIYNTGTEDINYVYVNDSCFMNFNVNHSCFGILRPGSSCPVNVTYRPQSAGYHSCHISVQASGTFGANIWISGQAEAAPNY